MSSNYARLVRANGQAVGTFHFPDHEPVSFSGLEALLRQAREMQPPGRVVVWARDRLPERLRRQCCSAQHTPVSHWAEKLPEERDGDNV